MTEPFIALSVLGLDIDEPGNGWAPYLAERDIKVQIDDLGRAAVGRDDARRLFTEKREAEQKARELAAHNERQAVEADRQWRASLPRGAAWYDVPPGVHPATAMLQHAKDALPRRTPSQVEWMFGETDTMVFHSLEGEGES
jgi:hypothetical protein